jgi:hypothetical protein
MKPLTFSGGWRIKKINENEINGNGGELMEKKNPYAVGM